MARPLSILDLARVGPHKTVAESFAASVESARHAEALGFHRVWYAEHFPQDVLELQAYLGQ
ncbi:alkanesulfonate monooxygenase SsuD/methylene tetrahydromethanopterin reductase-like flavin-dependent oxidoreductase (luciferase family) [Mycobacteroides chelonae]|nr:alkanesulfonate monooxygenase SsuD/methylene tetrahydromethanopterin reductase-like flavin-dependent oxidoreductase (luciferase family) [Mycobacteroides chelonae]